ncbi:2-amino-4-hydroxy-6-hydroxymethyldihydropteridine diphosphokinase [Tamaricihabitans halophyticus]|uniref:2-amino-4-hydroxy-6-hydroxymethyldihydropteridine diphosphokinase n=1 Tax=Tamaricihabitans halophyticus TaxID=1262583 RepID=A0A4R2R4M9_9PSEU|nr:2-amino-4-hydroxy-6-hydroxymethyldihydropteridine diphosphokinase [Tamaricihabitans halophyticus]TCP56729.1 2-amino-4-hydroxy-6-hydroxymethyldihydropteridine diphosphokinase [Tamaricihabitans halophyticus]
MTSAVLSIGSNLGDRLGYLLLAVRELGDAVQAASPVYQTPPWGVTDQPDFLNAVLLVADPARTEWDWLAAAQHCERAAERVRERHWGPRSLDVDVLTVAGVTSADERLRLPHPYAHERAFVLIPWLAVDPDAELPGHGRVVKLLAELPEVARAGVLRRDDLTLG